MPGHSWAIQDWFATDIWAHNHFMTIKYPNGDIRNAILLADEQHEIRAIEAGSDDVQIFRRVKGIWYSEEIEPVFLKFEWQRVPAPAASPVEECICPKTLAAQLFQTLFAGCEAEETRDTLPMFNAMVNSSFAAPSQSLGRLN